MKSFIFAALISLSINAFCDTKIDTDTYFKKAENSIIDILRSKNHYLDSRVVTLTYHPFGGISFGDCCFTTKEIVALDSKEKKELGSFVVTVGNNYGDYQKGLIITKISEQKQDEIRASFNCIDNARNIAKDLFANFEDLVDENDSRTCHYNHEYTYIVKSKEKTLGKLYINPIDCKFSSVSFEN